VGVVVGTNVGVGERVGVDVGTSVDVGVTCVQALFKIILPQASVNPICEGLCANLRSLSSLAERPR